MGTHFLPHDLQHSASVPSSFYVAQFIKNIITQNVSALGTAGHYKYNMWFFLLKSGTLGKQHEQAQGILESFIQGKV